MITQSNKSMQLSFQKKYWNHERFLSAPLILKIFMAFCFVIAFFGFSEVIFMPRSVREVWDPITGWMGTFIYLYPFFSTIDIIFTKDFKIKSRLRLLYYIFSVLFIQIIFAFIPLYDMLQPEYLKGGILFNTISRWQPLVTIILPLCWIIILDSKKVRDFCNLPYE